jgi:hypothetical protein
MHSRGVGILVAQMDEMDIEGFDLKLNLHWPLSNVQIHNAR